MLNRLRTARFLSGKTQEQVADEVGLTRTYYLEIEAGRRNPSLATAVAIGKAVGVDIDPDGLFQEGDYK